MKKKLYFLLLTFFFFNCFDSKNANEINENSILKSCFTKNDIKNIEKGVYDFENFLRKRYNVKNNDDIEFYLKYLEELSEVNPKIEFLKSKGAIQLLNQFKETSTFHLLYKRQSEIGKITQNINLDSLEIQNIPNPIHDSSEKENLIINDEVDRSLLESGSFHDYFVMYQNNQLLSCIFNKTGKKNIKEYISTFDDFIDFSPLVKAVSFSSHIKEKQQITEEITLLISYELFYGLILYINKI